MTFDGAGRDTEGQTPVSSRRSERRRRFAEAISFVVSWMALGWAFRLNAYGYLLLGIPLTATFQRLVARQPIAALFVRDARRVELDWKGMAVAVCLSVVPCRFLIGAARAGHWDEAAWAAACLGGAIFAAFAIRRAQPSISRALFLCLSTAGVVGSTIMVVAAYARLGGAGQASPFSRQPMFLLSIFLRRLLLFLPACFVVEEVTFRGMIDAHVQRPGENWGIGSALAVSALWGLWHLPIAYASAPSLAGVASLVVIHAAIGVPLSLSWRRSGNLLVPALSHAVIDAVRDSLMIASR